MDSFCGTQVGFEPTGIDFSVYSTAKLGVTYSKMNQNLNIEAIIEFHVDVISFDINELKPEKAYLHTSSLTYVCIFTASAPSIV